VDEKGRERKVRTDDRFDPRRHYYCFATNNPVPLYPTLIPKAQGLHGAGPRRGP
jgi:hypothetical protein